MYFQSLFIIYKLLRISLLYFVNPNNIYRLLGGEKWRGIEDGRIIEADFHFYQ